MKALREFVLESHRFIVAHRGSSGTAPENTLAALREAIAAGARMMEIDVRLTSDRQVVLLHDHVMGRTTSGSGKMKQMSFDELRQLDAGSWFDARFSGERVPLLKEALRLLRENECYVNIEIKPPSPEEDFVERIERIIEIVAAEDMIPNTLFGSFHHHSLKVMKERYPVVHTAAIQLPQDTRLPSQIAAEIGCEAFVCSLRECTFKRCKDVIDHGLYMGVYGVNTEAELRKLLRYPVAAIVTNFPKLMYDLLAAAGEKVG